MTSQSLQNWSPLADCVMEHAGAQDGSVHASTAPGGSSAPVASALPQAVGQPTSAGLKKHVEEAQSALVTALYGSILQSLVNPAPKQAACVELLSRIVKNVQEHPGEEKYRRVKATNEAFKTRVSSCKGGEEFLLAAGWRSETIEFTRHLVLPATYDQEVLDVAARLLDKCSQAVSEKAQRHEREQWLAKNEGELRRQSALQAIADDRARRRDATERAIEARRALQAQAEGEAGQTAEQSALTDA